MTHDELQEDLARHLRASTDRMVWTNTQLGPSGSPRPDAFSINKSYSKFQAHAYEIKVSVSDLRSDTTSGKWQKYLQFSHCVWFAIPAGLVRLDEIPRQAGVIVRHENVWRSARKPISQPLTTLPHDAWMKLLIESFPDPSFNGSPRRSDTWSLMDQARKRFGDSIGKLLADRNNARFKFEEATHELERDAERIKERQKRQQEQAQEKARELERSLTHAEVSLAMAIGLPETATPSELVKGLGKLDSALRMWSLKNTIRDLQGLQACMEGLKAPLAEELEVCP